MVDNRGPVDGPQIAKVRKEVAVLSGRYGGRADWCELLAHLGNALAEYDAAESRVQRIDAEVAENRAKVAVAESQAKLLPERVTGPFLAEWIGAGGDLDPDGIPIIQSPGVFFVERRERAVAPVAARITALMNEREVAVLHRDERLALLWRAYKNACEREDQDPM